MSKIQDGYLSGLGLLAVALVALAAAGSVQAYGTGNDAPGKNIVETASGVDDLSTLVTAVDAAGLVDTLSGEGPYTVFAPTNTAFDKLPEGTLTALLEPENQEQLQSVLTYHVVAGKAPASAVVNMIEDGEGSAQVETVQGQTLTLSLAGENVMVEDANGNSATVAAADVMTSNGVVHVIDSVLLPSE